MAEGKKFWEKYAEAWVKFWFSYKIRIWNFNPVWTVCDAMTKNRMVEKNGYSFFRGMHTGIGLPFEKDTMQFSFDAVRFFKGLGIRVAVPGMYIKKAVFLAKVFGMQLKKYKDAFGKTETLLQNLDRDFGKRFRLYDRLVYWKVANRITPEDRAEMLKVITLYNEQKKKGMDIAKKQFLYPHQAVKEVENFQLFSRLLNTKDSEYGAVIAMRGDNQMLGYLSFLLDKRTNIWYAINLRYDRNIKAFGHWLWYLAGQYAKDKGIEYENDGGWDDDKLKFTKLKYLGGTIETKFLVL